jgi:hypothetical protein
MIIRITLQGNGSGSSASPGDDDTGGVVAVNDFNIDFYEVRSATLAI